MSDNPMDKLPVHYRVSILAVLVGEGEDPSAALAEAGIVDSVVIPVVVGEELALSGGIVGNGITPNLTAVLETEQADASDSSPGTQPASNDRPQCGPVTSTLPGTFGLRPPAPVRRLTGFPSKM